MDRGSTVRLLGACCSAIRCLGTDIAKVEANGQAMCGGSLKIIRVDQTHDLGGYDGWMPEWLALPLPWYEVALRLTIAVICGAVIGFDREQRGHAAGLRTHMLIALGAATFALVGICLYAEINATALANGHQAPGDPLRTISGVVSGVGFLGAGAILHHRGRAIGLTTAAGIWTVAAIGVASGAGLHLIALMVTGLAFITLTLVGYVESMSNRKEHGVATFSQGLRLLSKQSETIARAQAKREAGCEGCQTFLTDGSNQRWGPCQCAAAAHS